MWNVTWIVMNDRTLEEIASDMKTWNEITVTQVLNERLGSNTCVICHHKFTPGDNTLLHYVKLHHSWTILKLVQLAHMEPKEEGK